MRRRRLVAVGLVAVVAAVAARVAAPAPTHSAGFSAALSCGVERWVDQDAERPPAPASGAGDDRCETDPASDPPLPSGQATARVRAPYLQRRRERDSEAGGRPRLPPRAPQRRPHDDRRGGFGPLHVRGNRGSAEADARRTQGRAGVHQGARRRRRVLRLPARPDGRGSERHRAPPRPGLRLPLWRKAASSSAAASAVRCEVRGVVPDGLHPAAASGSRLRRHRVPQLPRAGTSPTRTRIASTETGRRRLRKLSPSSARSR
jgi:hypothetical protein